MSTRFCICARFLGHRFIAERGGSPSILHSQTRLYRLLHFETKIAMLRLVKRFRESERGRPFHNLNDGHIL